MCSDSETIIATVVILSETGDDFMSSDIPGRGAI